MPILPFERDFLANPYAVQNSGMMLWAHIIFPYDKFLRDRAIHLLNIKTYEHLRRMQPSHFAPELIKYFQENPEVWEREKINEINNGMLPYTTLPEDPFSYLADSRISISQVVEEIESKEVLSSLKTVYYLACLILKIEKFYPDSRGGASLKKAIFVIENSEEAKRKGLFTNSTYIRQAWNKYRSVAHFMPVYFKLIYAEDERFFFFERQGIINFLASGYNLGKKISSVKVKNAKKDTFLLPESELWMMPEWFNPGEREVSVEGITEEEVKWLKRYSEYHKKAEAA